MSKSVVLLAVLVLGAMYWVVTSGDPNRPGCAAVWAAGRTLPADYRGCRDLQDEPAGNLLCPNGSYLETYQQFWAFRGGVIQDTNVTPQVGQPNYAATRAQCLAGH